MPLTYFIKVQYRFSADVASFPSQEFYKGRLQTGHPRLQEIASQLGPTSFPWPLKDNGQINPVVFVPCASEEDFGKASKGNEGQANLVKYIISLLRTPQGQADAGLNLNATSIAVLTPYSRQLKLLSDLLSSQLNVAVSTIDGFQGRESDIVVFSTVRCNMEGDIGFLEDEKRLNVAWTRPKLGLIIVGDRRTLSGNALWGRALNACREVIVQLPEPEEGVVA